MAETELTSEEAFVALEKYFSGQKVREIHGEFNVDPRRLYEVLDGDKHEHARNRFLSHMKISQPRLARDLTRSRRWRRSGSCLNDEQQELF